MQATGKAPEAAQKLEFDINQYPLSEVTLGAFPFVSLPAGYTDEGYGKTDKDFARFPFWVNGQAHWVEGRFHGQVFSAAPSKDFSAFEVSRNIEAMKVEVAVIRHRSAGAAHFLTRCIDGVVVNAGDGQHEHPTQGLLDALTVSDLAIPHLPGLAGFDFRGLRVAIRFAARKPADE